MLRPRALGFGCRAFLYNEVNSGRLRATKRGRHTNPSVYECPECGRQPLDVFARFEYSYELFEDDFPEFAGREQDLFSWFSLLGKCRRCSQLLAVADFECA